MKARYVNPVFPDGRVKLFTMSFDDGNDCDVKLIKLMRKYGVKGTFNVNSGLMPKNTVLKPGYLWRRLTAAEWRDIIGPDTELAVHGFLHPWWNRQSTVNAMQDILDDKRELERITGRIIRGAAFPNGTFTDDIVEILRLAGFAYCRTVRDTKKLHMQEENFLKLRATVKHDDPDAARLVERFASGAPRAEPWVLYLWGHSYEFIENSSWSVIERYLSLAGERDDVWYATNLEYVDYWNAARAIQYNVDCTLAANPTATDVWLRVSRDYGAADHVIVKIPAGATIALTE